MIGKKENDKSQTNEIQLRICGRIQTQIKKLKERGTIGESKSPHSSPAFIVQNHIEMKRGKTRTVVNYQELIKNTQFDGYFLPNKELFFR